MEVKQKEQVTLILISALLVFNLFLGIANYLKPPSATIYQGIFQAMGQAQAENLILRQQLSQLQEEYRKLQSEKK